MRSILLVEGKDDKAFIESLFNNLTVEVDEIEVNNDMNGLSKEGLIKALKVAQNKVRKFGVTKIGIIIDQDNSDEASRIAFVNDCLAEAFGVAINQETHLVEFTFEELNLTISCHFIKIDGIGELEGYLMKITRSKSDFADCLKEWRKCIGNDKISDKEFRKLWVHYYVRWDTSTDDERKHAIKNCKLEYSLKNKPQHWDFESDVLNPIKNYLAFFTT